MSMHYEGGMFEADFYADGDSVNLSVMNPDGEIIKEYRTEDEDVAQEIWQRICDMIDYDTESIEAFRLKRVCGHSVAKRTDIILE